jgi:hypothetical protein
MYLLLATADSKFCMQEQTIALGAVVTITYNKNRKNPLLKKQGYTTKWSPRYTIISIVCRNTQITYKKHVIFEAVKKLWFTKYSNL